MVLSHSFSVDETSFLLKLVIVSIFSFWSKSSRLKSKSFTFFGSIVFHLAATHWHCLRRRDWSNQFELRFNMIHCSCNMLQHDTLQLQHAYFFLPYWPYMCNGSSLFLLSFPVLSKVCGMGPLLTEVFSILLWWYSIYFLKGYGIAKVKAILIYSNYMLHHSYGH